MKLRTWQKDCVKSALLKYDNQPHFFCLASTGAGKSTLAASLAKRLLEDNKIDYAFCFVPSLTIANSLTNTFEYIIQQKFNGLVGSTGKIFTYQSMINLGNDFWDLLKKHRVFIVFDEVHHCAGDSQSNTNAWGDPILNIIKKSATYTLSLSGTPWRTDKLPITLSDYENREGNIKCDFVYGLSQAIQDKVCRSPNIVLIDNENIEVNSQQEKIKFDNLSHLIKNRVLPYQQIVSDRTAIKYVLAQAVKKLTLIRSCNTSAAGLVVTASVQHAQLLKQMLKLHFGQEAEIVTYREKDAVAKIERFKKSQSAWIVSVGMISEGTDIPRLQVCCHLSNVRTEMYFRQVLGRILRISDHLNQDAWLFTFADPNLVQYAERLNIEVPETTLIYQKIPDKEQTLSVACFSEGENNTAPELLGLSIQENTWSQSSNTVLSDFEQETKMILSKNFRQRIINVFNSPLNNSNY